MINEPGAAATSTAAAHVSIVEAGFVPRVVTIKVGERVTWANDDTVRHNVGGTGLVSGVILPGASYTHTFDAAGTYQYLCTFHPDTEGLVEVVPR
jgi:plastocyanin